MGGDKYCRFCKIDEAEERPNECFNINTTGAVLLADACKKRGISFMTFSSDQVFDGKKKGPYYESDSVNPLNVYGSSKATAEKEIQLKNQAALIIRTSSFFGPWDTNNFAVQVLNSLSAKKTFFAADNVFMSPTYIPHLVTVSLDLMIDKECGIWHLTNDGSISWKDFAKKIADMGGYDPELVIGIGVSGLNLKAQRPKNSVLKSQRGNFLRPIDHALNCFFNECIALPTSILNRHGIKTSF